MFPKGDNYYEYMLTEIPGERNHMLLTCIERYKSGSVLAFVKTSKDTNSLTATGKTLKNAMGRENIFLFEQ